MKELSIHTTKEELLKELEDWAIDIFGPTFKFRPKQKETIVDIIYSWYHGDKNFILDAPTGSGKSIIAMCVAGLLSDIYGKSGYILISDLSLLKQYEDDIDVYFPTWGVIRGRQTYTCQKNMMPFTVGVCALEGMTSYSDIVTNYKECAPYCEYIVAREKAMNSSVTVCTYAHWLLQQNYVRAILKDNAPFQQRDFVICDEAHKLVDIVQNHFSPRFGKEDMNKIYSIVEESKSHIENDYKQLEDIRNEIKVTTDVKRLKDLLNQYMLPLATIHKAAESIKSSFSCDFNSSSKDTPKMKSLSAADKKLLRNCEFVREHYCKFDDYTNIINDIGPEAIVKNDSENGNTIIFNCINESYLLKKTFHRNADLKLYMSATIGDPDIYANDICLTGSYVTSKLPICFDYSNSPIFYVNEYKMSYAEKDRSFPKIVKMIESILNMYPNKKGIIQTGSYAFANKLHDTIDKSLKSRLILYNDTLEKQESLDAYKYSDDKVLIGPSLVEGLSLDDDLCRFLIIMKIPYLSLADKYVDAKRKYNPIWYSNATSILMLQGIGRGVRNEHDWCVTFILDACFQGLFNTTRTMYPPEFVNRIQVINSNSLIK